jgi:hypothetical protein
MTAEDQSKKAPVRDILYDISVSELEMSYQIFDLFRRMGITSLGDCVDFYEQGNNAMITTHLGFIEAMETIKPEVKAMLKEKGYFFHFV